MAECGIKKYDELPSRVGFVDANALRYSFADARKKYLELKKIMDELVEKNKK